MTEFTAERRINIIESSIAKLSPSKAMGNCYGDAQTAIRHLTQSRLCVSGTVIRLTPGIFDSPTDLLTIYSIVAGGLTQVSHHHIALMDEEIIIDLGRSAHNRVFAKDAYYSLMRRLQS